MAYVVKARAGPGIGPAEAHFVNTRWRSDDPWGAIWRCLYATLECYIKWPPPLAPHEVATLQLTICFEPDKEDFQSALFPDDPLAQHRASQPKKRNSHHGKIPQK